MVRMIRSSAATGRWILSVDQGLVPAAVEQRVYPLGACPEYRTLAGGPAKSQGTTPCKAFRWSRARELSYSPIRP
jgi:hypothetical protein